MFQYFKFLTNFFVKRVPLWISIFLYWFFIVVILFIVPISIKINPLEIWTSEQYNVKSPFITIASSIAAMIVIFIFKEPIDDGSELIVSSKYLSRQKIIFIKFLWMMIISFSISFISSILSLLTLFLGNYDASNNPSGIQYGLVPLLFCSIFVATIVILLLFSSIAVLISLFASKIHIAVIIVGSAIIFDVLNIISPYVLTTLNNSVLDREGFKINSFLVQKTNNRWNSFAYINNDLQNDLYYEYLKYDQNPNAIYHYLNINGQLSYLYNSCNLVNSENVSAITPFGSSAIYRTTIKNKNSIFINYLNDYFLSGERKKNIFPMLFFMHGSIFNDTDIDTYKPKDTKSILLVTLGNSLSTNSKLDLFGCKFNTAYISNSKNFLFNEKISIPSIFISQSELEDTNKNYDKFNTDVYENITKALLVEPIYRKILNFTNDNSKSIMTSYINLCNTFMQNKKKEYGFQLDDITNLNISFAKIEYAIFKHFLSIYWNDLIPKYLDAHNIRFIDWIKYDESKYTHIANSISEEFEISNPISHKETTEKIKINMSLLFRYMLAYCSLSEINSTYKSNWHFGFSGEGLKIDGTPNFSDNMKASDHVFSLPVSTYSLTSNNISTIYLDKVYVYSETKYISNISIVIIWIFISFLLMHISCILQYKQDIY